jgi:hypothetical protein
MKLEEWKTYRTRFLVKAKKLSSALTFVDHLGRQHCGRKGDYLVESFDGVLSIAPRLIFEDIYVPMSLLGEPASSETTIHPPALNRMDFEPLQIEEVKLPKKPAARHKVDTPAQLCQHLVRHDLVRSEEATRNRGRRLPQASRDGRVSSSRMGLM